MNYSPTTPPTKFTPLQQEMLRLYAMNLPEENLLDIKNMIGNYLLDKLQQAVDESVEQNQLSGADFESWLNAKS